MKVPLLARNFFAYNLLTLTALLAASCASNSDSPNTENTDTTFRASETQQNTQLPPSTNQSSTNTTTESSPAFSENRTPANKATAVTAGGRHSCALHQDGTISCWGWNISGQLGNRTETDSEVPVEVMDITDATAISTGINHSCALHQTGTISCWGNNIFSQLGNRTNERWFTVPVEVVGITGATAITSGGFDSCALHQDGAISCWGSGYGDTDSAVSVELVSITDATAISPGGGYTCALHQDGAISCWGYNWSGQLGNGTDTDSQVPVEVMGIADATAITTGGGHACALHQTGSISCWGNNIWGQLGSGTDTWMSSVPVKVVGITDATAITTGPGHTCALHQTGTISCWGNNEYGQLGSRTDTWKSSVPVNVVGITDATAITAGGGITGADEGHTCALRQTGTISCWGDNGYGQLGNGTDNDSSVPVKAGGITDATAITTGDGHTCALRQTGTISCWGNNDYGQLGNRTDTRRSWVPVNVVGITDATAITAGGGITVAVDGHTCALHQDGTASCWGNNEYGQLGNRTDTDYWMPMEVVSIAETTAINTGGGHTCALHQDGTISCWGNNEYGQLGNGTDNDSSVPVKVVGITDATAINTGREHTCALHQTGTISCWGKNSDGQLGSRIDTRRSWVPVEVTGITDATAINAGREHTCALHQTGTISCWGDNYYGKLGNGTDTRRSWVPVEVVGITDATAITAGTGHTCALHQTGTISCWGNNYYGQLGNGQGGIAIDSSEPVEVIGITDATAINTGRGHTCALHQDGTISCWGNNNYGELGSVYWLPKFVVGFGG